MTAHNTNTLICDSRAIGAIWRKIFDRDSTFIPYGAPVLDDVGHDRLDAMDLGSRSYLLVVARLTPENNVDLTLDALELLGDDAPQAVIVGSANFDSPIEDRLRKMEAGGHLIWLGHVDDQQLLTQLWAHSAVYVQAIRWAALTPRTAGAWRGGTRSCAGHTIQR